MAEGLKFIKDLTKWVECELLNLDNYAEEDPV